MRPINGAQTAPDRANQSEESRDPASVVIRWRLKKNTSVVQNALKAQKKIAPSAADSRSTGCDHIKRKCRMDQTSATTNLNSGWLAGSPVRINTASTSINPDASQ